ncbi:MAG TPA: DMT family transporter [Anaerolineales bacterium]|nr:DMT family transporter [Anaerolineales bacterium]
MSAETGPGGDSSLQAPGSGSHRNAVGLALLVTILWASSYILVKIGLREIPPLTFAGMRYFLGFVVLFLLHRIQRRPVPRNLPPATWRAMFGLGLVAYALAPGAMFLSLSMLPVITANFVFQAGIPLLVAISSGMFLGERTSLRQWFGVALTIGGVYLAFPLAPAGGELLGILLAGLAAAAGAASNQLTRFIMRDTHLRAQDVTMITVGIGSSILLAIGLLVEPLPAISLESVGLLLWLAVVNTAIAFTLWNIALRTLRALEAGVIATAQVIEVTLMAWLILGEPVGLYGALAAVLILAGVILVQTPSRVPRPAPISEPGAG